MSNRRYRNFDILIHDGSDSYIARVLDSPAGQASTPFQLPFSANQLAEWLGDSSLPFRNISPTGLQNAGRVFDARQFGTALYEAVFRDSVAMALVRSLDRAEADGQGLRIRLRISDDVPELATLPWEYLYSRTWNRFIALSSSTPLVRYIEVPEPPEPLDVAPPLHILAFVSDPQDVTPLNVDQEWHQLQNALADLQSTGQVMLERLPVATYAGLNERLSGDPIHVLHFIGHGYFWYDPEKGTETGGLVFEDDNGNAHQIDAAQLGALLHDHESLRLAFLNACDGAQGGESDLFAGVAQYLVQQKAPAVIAMQFPVSDTAAITLSSTFYSRLADGAPVDSALTEARKALFGQTSGSEWATPVLFSRSPDNRLLRLPEGDARPTIERHRWEPETLLVDAGPFTMGREPGPGMSDHETPAHLVDLVQAYRLGRTPVTVAQYAEFIAQSSNQPTPQDRFLRHPPEDRLDHPVTEVSWHEAMAYCAWLSRQTGRRYRLPSEAEWEKAARGVDARPYPWGDEWFDQRCNADSGETTPVETYPEGAGPYGNLDMLGNVQEWTSTLWGGELQTCQYPYPYRPDDGREDPEARDHRDKAYRIHRGGSYRSKPATLHAAKRSRAEANSRSRGRGFRVLMEL